MNGKIGEQNSDPHRRAKTTRTGSVHCTIRHFFSETISVRVSLPTIDDVPGAAVNSQHSFHSLNNHFSSRIILHDAEMGGKTSSWLKNTQVKS